MAEGFSLPHIPHNTFSLGTMSVNPGGPVSPSPSATGDNPGGPLSGLPQSDNPGGPASPASDPNSLSTTPSATPTDSMTTTTPPTNPTTTSPIGSPTAVGAASTHHSHAGAIAGAVIGALAALALLGLFGLCLRRRRRRAGAAPLASPPLESARYTEPKPRSRTSSRVVGAPAHTAHSASVGTIESFGGARTTDSHATLGEARTYESQGTLADVRDDEDAYLEKLEAAEGPILGGLPTLPDPFTLARPPPASPHTGVRDRRSVGETLVVSDHAYNHSARRARTRSQDLSARVPVPVAAPGSPTYPPTSPTATTAPRKTPRKKPVPRYSADGVPQIEGTTPPGPASPFADAAARPFHDGRPVHYLIPDMPAPQR